MKKISFISLLVSLGVIIYFFIKEQFRGIILSQKENILLSATYLVIGISFIILFRIKHLENKTKENLKK